jgi:hypothetical protein
MGRADMEILVRKQCTVIFDGAITYAPAWYSILWVYCSIPVVKPHPISIDALRDLKSYRFESAMGRTERYILRRVIRYLISDKLHIDI